jgi:hypothetical protein
MVLMFEVPLQKGRVWWAAVPGRRPSSRLLAAREELARTI